MEIAAPAGADKDKRQFEEFGDVMFVIVNLGLHLGIDAESALRAANQKFVGRWSRCSLKRKRAAGSLAA